MGTLATRLDALTTALTTRFDPQIQHVFMLRHHQLSNKFVHIELKLFDWMMMKLTKALSKTMNFTAKRQMLKFLSKKFGFLVVDGNNLALDIARTTDYGDNWAFKNYGPIHHRDEEHVDLQPFTLMAAMWYKGEKRYVATQRVLAASPIRR